MNRPAPEMQAVLERLAAQRAGLPDRYTLPYPEARQQLLREREPWLADGPSCPTSERMVRTDARTLYLRAYQPAGADRERLLVYFHGGGWCVGSVVTHDNIVRRMAVGLRCEAWSLEYSLAPESPWPEGLLDSTAAVRLAAMERPQAQLILAGDSAGANLALDVALRLKNDAARPLHALLLFYGVYTASVAGRSMAVYADGRYGLSRRGHERYLEAYCGVARAAGSPAPFALDERTRLEGLPPIRLTVAELDILRDQSHALADKLRRAQQLVELEEVPGVVHGFLSYGRDLPQAGQAIEAACAWLLRLPTRKAAPVGGLPRGQR